jgi:hypothetical protein
MGWVSSRLMERHFAMRSLWVSRRRICQSVESPPLPISTITQLRDEIKLANGLTLHLTAQAELQED